MAEKHQRKPKQQDTGKDKDTGKKSKPKIRKRRNPLVPKFFEDVVVKS